MKTGDFNYNLPEELIAQFPSEKRDDCKLLHLNRIRRGIDHCRFKDITSFLKPGDHLVFNDTKVLPARILCRKETGGVGELLFIEKVHDLTWKALVKTAKRVRKNMSLFAGNSPATEFVVNEPCSDGSWLVSLRGPEDGATLESTLQKIGTVPLPPYIKRDAAPLDRCRYQTIFAKNSGAIASPTAGLHFTEEIVSQLQATGIEMSFVTLHVGIGTFRPVKTSDPRNHAMHQERYHLSEETASRLTATKRNGGRVIAVGTTVVRVLEHCSREHGYPVSSSGSTRLLILPGYSFRAIDAMITNFHVPQSTLLMLVCAFADKDIILNAYQEAVKLRYRFFSYGDAMMIE